ncbi:MAG: hypothetical protein FJ247_13610 [Nitrospira sp.]|nr:hypothetical protein [Nitrospira sp.]
MRTANRLFREGDYPAVLGMYLWLGQQCPLPMYGDNAVRAAKRASMPWVKAAGMWLGWWGKFGGCHLASADFSLQSYLMAYMLSL